MHKKLPRLLAVVLLSWIVGTVNADERGPVHTVVAPSCLVKAAGVTAKPLAATGDRVMVEVDDKGMGQLVKARIEALRGRKACGDFLDVTRALQASSHDAKAFLVKSSSLPKVKASMAYTLRYPAEVNQLLASINPDNMWTELTTLTRFKDRYANSRSGVKAAEWIQGQVREMAKGRSDVSVFTIPTTGYKQPSVVLKVGDSTEPGIVLSGSMDTPDSGWWFGTTMPGAGINGSGSVTVLEAARTVLASGMHFQKPLYFVWYGAEMEGRVGSSEVVREFQFEGKPTTVAAALNFQWVGNGRNRTMWLMQEHADPELNRWLASLIHAYVKQEVLFEQWGFSRFLFSHASWSGAGVPAASAVGDNIWSLLDIVSYYEEDTLHKISLQHMTDYLKLAVAFAVEGAEPVRD